MAEKTYKIDPNTSPIALRNTVSSYGNYNVSAQATPKTNSALQFSQALSKVPGMLKDLSAIGKKQAEEDLLKITNPQELEKALADGDTGTMKILGYSRTYNEGLVSKYLTDNAAKFTKEWNEMGNDPENWKKTPEEIVDYINEQKEASMAELREVFGQGNVGRDRAILGLGTAVFDKLGISTQAQIIKNQEEQTRLFQSERFSNNITSGAMSVTEAIDFTRDEMIEEGLDGPKEISANLMTYIEGHAATLLENDDFEAARQFVIEAKNYKLFEGATLGGSAENKTKFSTINKAIDAAQKNADLSFARKSDKVDQAVDLVILDGVTSTVTLETYQTSVKDSLIAAGMSEEDAAEEIENITEKMDPIAFNAYWRNVARKQENQSVKELMLNQLDSMAKFTKEYMSEGELFMGTFSADDINTVKENIRAQLKENPNLSIYQWNRSVGGRKMNMSDEDWQDIVSDITQEFGYIRNENSAYNSIITSSIKTISQDKAFGIFGSEYAVKIQNDITTVAPDLWKESNGDVSAFNLKLNQYVVERESEYREDAILRNTMDNVLTLDLSNDLVNESLKDASGGFKDSGFKVKADEGFLSFEKDYDTFLKKAGSGPKALDIINSDRNTLMAVNNEMPYNIKRRALRASITRWGFVRKQDFDLNLIQQAGLGFNDFELSKQLLQTLQNCENALLIQEGKTIADTDADGNVVERNEMTKQEKEDLEFWTQWGIDTLEDIAGIEEAQKLFMNTRGRL